MKRSEKVRCLGGPGGLRCPCCGGGGGRMRHASKRSKRALVKRARRDSKAFALKEGVDNLS